MDRVERIYLTSPIPGTIVSASVNTHSTVLSGSAKIRFEVVVDPDGTPVSSSLVGSVFTQPGADYITTARGALVTPLTIPAGGTINIKYISDMSTLMLYYNIVFCSLSFHFLLY